MAGRFKDLYQALAMALVVITIVVGLWLYYGLYLNVSHSVSGILWQTEPFQTATLGQYVIICPSANFAIQFNLSRHVCKSGSCGGSIPLLKRIVAIPGQHLRIDQTGIHVNGQILQNTRPFTQDGHGQWLPVIRWNGVVPTGSVAVSGDTATSFDSRYFGLIATPWITRSAALVF